MMHLLFMVAFVDTPADKPALPPRPPAAVAAPASTALEPLAPGKITDGPVACNQALGCGSSEPQPTVVIEDGFGFTAETSATWDRGAVKRLPEYSARLDAELCEVKPWFCS